jgi:hyperosmotically inducible periplasmic protein
MKRILLGFIIGLVAGALGYSYLTDHYRKEDLDAARAKLITGADKVKTAIQDKISEIRTEDVKDELNRTGMIVREKAKKAGEALADATSDARITAAIKAKFLKEPGLSSMKIHVETTDGLVTLSGTVPTHEEVAKAVKLSLETDGVQKVISTLQVKPGV